MSATGSASQRDLQLKLLTLNCWGLKYVAKHRVERIRAIADELAVSDYDIIALQELWVYTDFQLVRSKLIKRLPFSKFFYSGALGAGLVIFSRYPIIEASTRPYSLNGSPIDVLAGDWFVGKAAASALISHPILGDVEVYNTHLYAKGGESDTSAHRLVNAWEFSKLVRTSAELGRYVIAMGDFNSIPTSLPVTIIKEHTLLEDAWPSSHDTAFFRPPGVVHNAQHAIHGFGVTADSPMNSYTAGKPLDDEARRWQGKRLDYIFFRKPAPSRRKLFHQRHHQLVNGTEDTDSFTPSLVCKETKVVLTSKVPGFPFSYSDHFGVEATLEIRFPSTSSTPQDHLIQDENVIDFTDSPSPSPAEPAAGPSATHATGPVLISDSGLTEQTLTHTLRALANAYTLSRRRARYHLVIFALCLFASIGLAIGSGWQPVTAINPFVALAVLALGWLGTTMLYVGFIFGRWELNALTGIIEELELWGNRQEFENRP